MANGHGADGDRESDGSGNGYRDRGSDGNGNGDSTAGREAVRVDRVMDGLRAFGANYTEFTRRFATWLGLHSTDAAALVEILYAEDQGTPLSPARLSERVSLSSGATAILLKRLEQAGHIVRTRESTDRRVVTLRSSPGIRPRAIAFFGPYSERMTEAMAAYSPQEIQHFEKFLGTLRTTMDALLAHEYEGGGPTPPHPLTGVPSANRTVSTTR
ncbi:MarR family winged helix-turn-helix transcriptional regulator [Streptomyces anulatus]|uniref:MarR family winged helix-turn-helix transcriptional regulator n=2 Tax=Streptomyces anulatus TaxID=1892 RepID=UPI0022543C5A|nr:MarR family winged helix-turn-helix transcriptional regulator [Streptomyces anulatus]MCX4518369.1 MarR family winged helix-turn-helix transcriptional regulator [Streptomyces anulatus]WTD27987.1 MarR family winged helix-turn-helix transcriptional regulator [Streptomyces anulatus]